jgi:ElaB/YqjD/DUF883 family membrane-anchored ribosome-binding protein
MENDKTNNKHQGSPTSFAEATQRGEDRLEETAQEYLNEAGVGIDSNQILSLIRDQPLKAAGIAAAAGFVVGGGLAGAAGLAVFGMVARTAVRSTVFDLIGMARKQFGGASGRARVNA